MHNLKSVELFCHLKLSVCSCACRIRNKSVIQKGVFCIYQVALEPSFSVRLSLFSFNTLPYRVLLSKPTITWSIVLALAFGKEIQLDSCRLNSVQLNCSVVMSVCWMQCINIFLHVKFLLYGASKALSEMRTCTCSAQEFMGCCLLVMLIIQATAFKQNVKMEVLTLQWSVVGN